MESLHVGLARFSSAFLISVRSENNGIDDRYTLQQRSNRESFRDVSLYTALRFPRKESFSTSSVHDFSH